MHIVVIAFLVIAIPALFTRLFRNYLSWFVYSGFTTMLIFLPPVLEQYSRYSRFGRNIFSSHFYSGIEWEPGLIWGTMAIFISLMVCNHFMPGGQRSFGEVRRMLAFQILLYWFFPVLLFLLPVFGEIYQIFAIPLVPGLLIAFLIRPRGSWVSEYDHSRDRYITFYDD